MPTSSAPLPRPAIHVEGAPSTSLTQDLLALTIEDALSTPARCIARFANSGASEEGDGYRYFGLHDFDFGRRLTVWQGEPPNTLFRLFEGRIHRIEGSFRTDGPPEVVLQAEDPLQELRLRSRTRMFQDMSDAMIVGQIAGEHGLTAQVEGAGLDTLHPQVAQVNQSDLAFLLDRLAGSGMAMWIDGSALVVTDEGPASQPDVLVYGEGLLELQVGADLRGQATILGVSGWDVRGKQVIGEAASDADLPAGEEGRSGGRILEEAFGRRLEAVVDAVPSTSQEARSMAVALHRTRSAEFVTARGTAAPSPGLRVGRTVRLQGVGPLFSGTYQITTVRHHFDVVQGFRTTFEARRPRLGRGPSTQTKKEVHHAPKDPGAHAGVGGKARRRAGSAPRKRGTR